MFSQQHYIAIAETLANSKSDPDQHDIVVYEFAHLFHADNSRFKSNLFISAAAQKERKA